MLRRIFLAAVLAGAGAFGIYWWLTAPPTMLAVTASADAPDLANGLTTFNAGGCSSCHAVPGQPDRTRLGGGLAIPSPFGTFYAPNISPDPVDGIGRWSEAEFVRAVTQGISPAGFHYFPAFPYASYQHAKVEDVRDLFAYLKTLPAVSGKVRDHDVPFPFNVRRNIAIWKWDGIKRGRPFHQDQHTISALDRIALRACAGCLPGHPDVCHSSLSSSGCRSTCLCAHGERRSAVDLCCVCRRDAGNACVGMEARWRRTLGGTLSLY